MQTVLVAATVDSNVSDPSKEEKKERKERNWKKVSFLHLVVVAGAHIIAVVIVNDLPISLILINGSIDGDPSVHPSILMNG